MKFITKIAVQRFRSLADTTVEQVGDFSCLVGTNNSGKSNLLRALCLFFTGNPEPGVPLDFGTDYYADPKSKKKKVIQITVWFDLPPTFTFRKGLEPVESALGRIFAIRKLFDLTGTQPKPQVLVGGTFRDVEPDIVKRFLDLVNFRYIQNRTVPPEVLRAESRGFRTHVGRRLREKGADADKLLAALREAASEVVLQTNRELKESTTSIANLEMSLPVEMADLAAVSGFRAHSQTGAPIRDTSWGSGTQAYVMFHLLKMIDTDFGRHFGWKQGTIWAVEEPESSLHRDLEKRLAVALHIWASDPTQRMQILSTTHSEVILTAATKGFLVDLSGGRTEFRSQPLPELVYNAAALGISGPTEPVLCFPLNPVILVEGPLDRRILEHVAAKTGTASKCVFLSLQELDPAESGGGADNIINYLKKVSAIIQNRPVQGPFLVLFDWDVDDKKLHRAKQSYGPGGDSRVMRMNPEHADPRVRKSIHGIERFYPYDLFVTAREKGTVNVAFDQHDNVSIDPDELRGAKSKLAELFVQAPADEWYRHLSGVLADLDLHSRWLPGTPGP